MLFEEGGVRMAVAISLAMSSMAKYLSIALFFTFLRSGYGARILGIFPTPSISHQLPFQVIMKALAARGHQVTVISPNPLKSPVENYTDIDLSFSYDYWRETADFASMDDIEPIDSIGFFIALVENVVDLQLGSNEIQNFIRFNDSKFDLVIYEKLPNQAYHGLVHHVGSPPTIAVLSLGGMSVTYGALGNPYNPSFCPDPISSFSDRMDFRQRMFNLYIQLRMYYFWNLIALPRQEALMRKYFGSAPPSVYESEYNDSLLLLNNQWSINYPRPLLPNVIELTGLHVRTTKKPLPKNIQSFLDEAKHGAVYFSLGSNVMSSSMPKDKLKHILDTFSEIPQRVLWKWETDSLPGQPSNVMLSKWLPQQDILAHPNVRVFITQGGLQSFQEAAYHGVPLIGIPFIGDQRYNVQKFEAAKIGVRVTFKDLTKDTLLEALGKVLNDSTYRNNMETFSSVYREEVEPSLDRAIYWIEYVLRHNGARHLKSAALELTWYQYLLLDVIAVVLIIIILSLIISYIVLKTIVSYMLRTFRGTKLKSS